MRAALDARSVPPFVCRDALGYLLLCRWRAQTLAVLTLMAARSRWCLVTLAPCGSL